MEWSADGKKAVGRLILCGGLAAVLLEPALKLSALEEYRPWLEAHRLEAGAALAAALFGASLLLFPLKQEEGEEEPCQGYSPVV